MDLLEKVLELEGQLQDMIADLDEEVDEANDNYDGIMSGEYDFGHAQDSYDRGRDDGMTIGEYEVLYKILRKIENILK